MEVLLAESFLYSKRQRDGFSMCFSGEHVREACRLTRALIEEQNKAGSYALFTLLQSWVIEAPRFPRRCSLSLKHMKKLIRLLLPYLQICMPLYVVVVVVFSMQNTLCYHLSGT